jgi:hypothetical protein
LLVAVLRAASTGACFYGREWECRRYDERQCPSDAADYAARVAAWAGGGRTDALRFMRQVEAALVRCLFGNPFRPVVIDPGWLQWDGGAVPRIAEAIYEDRAFDRLPILADALEEAGCTDADVLGHCRGPGPHARGCWVTDLLLRKN